jgi:hypothetical protein
MRMCSYFELLSLARQNLILFRCTIIGSNSQFRIQLQKCMGTWSRIRVTFTLNRSGCLPAHALIFHWVKLSLYSELFLSETSTDLTLYRHADTIYNFSRIHCSLPRTLHNQIKTFFY